MQAPQNFTKIVEQLQISEIHTNEVLKSTMPILDERLGREGVKKPEDTFVSMLESDEDFRLKSQYVVRLVLAITVIISNFDCDLPCEFPPWLLKDHKLSRLYNFLLNENSIMIKAFTSDFGVPLNLFQERKISLELQETIQ